MKKMILAVLLLMLVQVATGCSKESASENDKLKVYTSFYAMYDFTDKIGGDKIELVNIVPSGTEPHDWEPTATVIAKLESADLLIYNGAGFEGWMDKVKEAVGEDKIVFVETSANVKLLESHHEHADEEHADETADEHADETAEEHADETAEKHAGETADEHEAEHDHGAYDPHVWLDPMNAKLQMEAIKNALVKADPTNKDTYQSNYDKYAKELDALDKEFKDAVATFSNMEIIVAHEAYGYLCHAYGFTQMGIEGLNADSEPSPARMAELADYAKEHGVKTIFFEELISPKVAEALANEVGAKTAVLDPIEGLTEEDMKAGRDYLSVMRDNLAALKEALQ